MKFLKVFILCLTTALAYDFRGSIPYKPNNGHNASKNQFPYQVGLFLHYGPSNNFWCSGSLIASNWILTAASCIDGAKNITVHLGSNIRIAGEVSYNVSQDNVIIHEDYDVHRVTHDIALIEIPWVDHSDNKKIVGLPSINAVYGQDSFLYEYVNASGWGKDYATAEDFYHNLHWVRMQVTPNNVCRNFYGIFSNSSLLCVDTAVDSSICKVDSGAPLVLQSNGNLIGLLSFYSNLGCKKGHPAAFTRISSYLVWIRNKTGIAYYDY